MFGLCIESSGRGDRGPGQTVSRERRRGRVALLKPVRSARRLAGRGERARKGTSRSVADHRGLCTVCVIHDVVDSRAKAGTSVYLLKAVHTYTLPPRPPPPCDFKLSHAPDGWRVRVRERWMNGLVMDDDADDKPHATRRLAWPGCLAWPAWLAWRTRTRRANQGAAPLQCDRGKLSQTAAAHRTLVHYKG